MEQTTEPVEEEVKQRFTPAFVIKNFLFGVVIGGGAILPGISGGVLCVIFGIYRPMMELFSRPGKALKKNWKMFLVIAIGFALGFWIFAYVVDILFKQAEIYGTWLFIGLIIGTIPALCKEAGKKGRTNASWISLFIAFIILFASLFLVRIGLIHEVQPNFWWYIFCGVLWGLSLVIPGMSSSSVLIALGIYEPMNEGIVDMNMSIVFPWVAGLVVTALALGRLVNYCFDKFYSISYHAVIGVVLASTIIIIPTAYSGIWEFVLCLICGIIGVGISLISAKEPKHKS